MISKLEGFAARLVHLKRDETQSLDSVDSKDESIP
jgi:hypothetical protein